MSHPLALLRRMTVDFETRRCEVELLDDTAAGEDLRTTTSPVSSAAPTTPRTRALTLVLQGVGEIVAEVGGRLGRAEPLEGRVVVSSTKTIWITLARHVHSPVKLPKGERGPAARLLELGRSGRVILPLPHCPLRTTSRPRVPAPEAPEPGAGDDAALAGASNARSARPGSPGDVGQPSAVHRQMQPAAQTSVTCK